MGPVAFLPIPGGGSRQLGGAERESPEHCDILGVFEAIRKIGEAPDRRETQRPRSPMGFRGNGKAENTFRGRGGHPLQGGGGPGPPNHPPPLFQSNPGAQLGSKQDPARGFSTLSKGDASPRGMMGWLGPWPLSAGPQPAVVIVDVDLTVAWLLRDDRHLAGGRGGYQRMEGGWDPDQSFRSRVV